MKPKVEKSSVNSWDKLWSSFDEKKGYGYQLTLEEHRVRWQRIQETILNKYGTFSGLECIEIGAGSGSYSILFSRRGARVTILDYSEKALTLCKQIFKKQGILSTQVNFLLMDALKMDEHLFGKFDISMSFGVAEHFHGDNRKVFIKNHFRVLKEGGVAFISVPHKDCIPYRMYQFLMNFVNRNIVEAYPFTRKEFINIIKEFNIKEYSFIGSSIYETYNPLSFYRREKGLVRDISFMRKERGTFLDQYMGRELTLVETKRKKLDYK